MRGASVVNHSVLRGAGVLFLGLVLTACALSPSTDGPVRTYVLMADEAAWNLHERAAQPVDHGVLLVDLPQTEAGFDQARMAYVQRPSEVRYYATNQWADAPARMLLPLLVRSLETTGLWRAVVAMPTTVRGDYRLDLSGLLLQQEFLERPSRMRVRWRAQLVDLKEQRVVETRNFEAVESAPSEDAYGGVLAANRAVETMLRATAQWMTACVGGGKNGAAECAPR